MRPVATGTPHRGWVSWVPAQHTACCCRWLSARQQIWQADDGEAAPLSLKTGHPDERLPLHATEAMAPLALHELKAAAVSLLPGAACTHIQHMAGRRTSLHDLSRAAAAWALAHVHSFALPLADAAGLPGQLVVP